MPTEFNPSGPSSDWGKKLTGVPFDWALIPCDGLKRPINPKSGTPKPDWANNTYDVPGICGIKSPHVKAIGVVLGPASGGLLAVDFDGIGSADCFKDVFSRSHKDLPLTVGWSSGRPQRAQIAFRVPFEYWEHLRGRRFWELNGKTVLELRWEGHQSVIAGAHPDTAGYHWLKDHSPEDLQVAEAPEWLLDPLFKAPQETIHATYSPGSSDTGTAVDLLAHIKARDDYSTWLKVGMALHSVSEGLLEDWVNWSRGCSNFDEAECLAKWLSFKGHGVTIGSLYFLAREDGYEGPKRDKPKSQPENLGFDDEDEEGLGAVAQRLDLDRRLAEGRRLFSLEKMLPQPLAHAVDILQRPLPTDPLSATLPLLCGYSGLLKLGTRVSSSLGFEKPANLFVASVLRTGLAKTNIKTTLVDAPAKDIRLDLARDHSRAMENWKEQNKGTKPDDRPPAPKPVFVHITDYTPAALYKQLQLNDERRMGQLIVRDELSGFLGQLAADAKSGTGTADAQLLELFDGDGYTGLRVTEGARSFERCHVSLYGNVQPDVLKAAINGQDETGKFARFLFCRVPNRPLELRDDDPTADEKAIYSAAEQTVRDYAKRLFCLPPRTYHFSQSARERFHAWFKEHQNRSLLPGTPKVVSALLGKTSAHALRLAGILHLLKVAANELDPQEQISPETVDIAMSIVDQLTAETEAFHEEEESKGVDYMRHIHQLSRFTGAPVSRQDARDKSGKAIRDGLMADVFTRCIEELQRLGYGQIIKVHRTNGKSTNSYQATAEMP